MGSCLSLMFGSPCLAKRAARVMLLGLDGAGKTTLLYKLKLGEVVETVSTVGFNVETIVHKQVSLTFWDAGGLEKIRLLWRSYLTNTDAVVFVVDSCDVGRLDEARKVLDSLLQDESLQNTIFLVFANKSDDPGALATSELTSSLGLCETTKQSWFIQRSCALTEDGVTEGLDWLCQQLLESPSRK